MRPSGILSSVRVRIILVILLSTLPLALSAGLLAWQDYGGERAQSARRVQAALERYLAHERDVLQDGAALLSALGAVIRPDRADECRRVLDLASLISHTRLVELGVVTSAGHTVCSAGGHLVTHVPHGMFGAAWRRDDGVFVVSAAVALSSGDRLVGAIRLDVPTGASASVGTWLIVGGRAVPLARASEPPPGDLARLASGGVVRADEDVFVAGTLPGGSTLAMGDRATQSEARAVAVLFERIAFLATLLGCGLVLVAVAAHVTVAAPIQALTRRVTRWRTEGQFDDARMQFVPAELAALIDAFGLATRSLRARELELEKAREEQELAFKEIHHRVKNNLQIIASLLNLQANRIRQPEARAEFQSARDRVRALATLHRHLYGEGGLHTIALRSFLLELCGQLFQAIGEREGHRITLDVEAPELEMSSDQAVPIALIVTEAVGNAVKYAFPGGRSGLISVRLALLPDDRISLTIRDDGVGIPSGRAETETGVRDGLGIQLIRGFAKQLGATLEVTEVEGTVYHLELALHRDGRRKAAA